MNRLLILWWNLMCSLAFPAAAGASPLAVAADGGASPAPASGGQGAPQGTQAPSTGAQPVSPAGGQQQGATPAPNPAAGQGGQGQPNDANLAQLRTNYERYRSLGEYDAVQSGLKGWQGIQARATQLADDLGYTRESLAEALADDPIGTLTQLNSEYAQLQKQQAGQPQDVNKLVDSAVRKATQPVLDQYAQQKADAAQQLFDTEVTRLMTAHDAFKGMDVSKMPDTVRQALQGLVAASIQQDRDAMNRLVNEKKVSDVQKHFDTAINSFLGVINAWNQYLGKATTQAPAAPGNGQPPKQPTLQDFIEGNAVAQAAAPKSYGF